MRGAARLRSEGQAVGTWPAAAFTLGLALVYLALQSYLDYVSQHMFWVHRAQHLVLHHMGPFLVAVSQPQAVMSRGVPLPVKDRVFVPLWRNSLTQHLYRFVQGPVVAPLLFVGLIYFWLSPSIHFAAMLSLDRYQAMNWSMVIDGLLFWWVMLDRRSPDTPGVMGYGTRILILWAAMLSQIALGAYITFRNAPLYDVYNVCGRAWPISPLVDQEIGGLITWIPSSMMSVIAGLVVLRLWIHETRSRDSADAMRMPACAAQQSAP